MNPDYENINTDDILDEVNQDVVKILDPLFEALNPRKKTEYITLCPHCKNMDRPDYNCDICNGMGYSKEKEEEEIDELFI